MVAQRQLPQLYRSNRSPSGVFVFPSFPSEFMTAYPVSPKINKASFNSQKQSLPSNPPFGDGGVEHREKAQELHVFGR
jgi:hypothetical protein